MKRAKKVKELQSIGGPEVERPAVIAADHVKDRVLSAGAGAKKGWSRLTVYEREFRKGSFVCRERCTGGRESEAELARAAERFAAARAFDEGWQVCAASWPGSSGFDRVKGGGGVPGAFADHQRDVKDYWRGIESAMGANDWLIVRRVCGENYTVAQAVAQVSPGYRLSTLARFREALDSLVAGRAMARRRAP